MYSIAVTGGGGKGGSPTSIIRGTKLVLVPDPTNPSTDHFLNGLGTRLGHKCLRLIRSVLVRYPHASTLTLASFPGPAQLFITCSIVEKPWMAGSCHHFSWLCYRHVLPLLASFPGHAGRGKWSLGMRLISLFAARGHFRSQLVISITSAFLLLSINDRYHMVQVTHLASFPGRVLGTRLVAHHCRAGSEATNRAVWRSNLS